MKKAAALFVSILILAAGIFSSCSVNIIDNNAVILNDNAAGMIDPGFHAANHIRGVYEEDGTHIDDETLPESRYFIVRSREEQDAIFIPGTDLDVNYSDEMILVYTFRAIYIRPIRLQKLITGTDQIDIELNMRTNRGVHAVFVADACQPFQRYVIIKMDSISTSEVQFKVID